MAVLSFRFVNSATYYGLSWNTSNLGGNDYLNFLVSGVVEIPGYILMLTLLNRWGRKGTLCFALIVAGVALLLTLLVPASRCFLIICKIEFKAKWSWGDIL